MLLALHNCYILPPSALEEISYHTVIHCVHWYGHVLRREDGHVLRRVLDFEVGGQREKGSPKRMWKRQVEEKSVKVGLRRNDAVYRSKLSVGVKKIAAGLRCIWPPSFIGDTTRFKTLVCVSLSL